MFLVYVPSYRFANIVPFRRINSSTLRERMRKREKEETMYIDQLKMWNGVFYTFLNKYKYIYIIDRSFLTL